MVDFDAIHGMDWLSPNHAILNCQNLFTHSNSHDPKIQVVMTPMFPTDRLAKPNSFINLINQNKRLEGNGGSLIIVLSSICACDLMNCSPV